MNSSFPILFEDDAFVVINKPAGITVNRAETTKNEQTIQDWAEQKYNITFIDTGSKFGDADWKPEDEFYKRGGIVHRLDKETSGILLVAKTPESFVNLQKQFRERSIKKTYVALAHGILTPQEGIINVPVGRLPWNRNRFGVLPGGRESKTLYTVSKYYLNADKEKLSFITLNPQSGRTHQIRVHLKYVNHPIFADFLYAGRKTARKDRHYLQRVFLHAAQLQFQHPVTNEEVSLDAPLALELASYMQTLQEISL